MGFIHFTTPRNAVTRGFVRKVVKWTFSLFFVLVSTDTDVWQFREIAKRRFGCRYLTKKY